MIEIIKSNLTSTQTDFIKSEIIDIEKNAERHCRKIKNVKIVLEQKFLLEEKFLKFKDFAHHKRKQQSWEITQDGDCWICSGGGYNGTLYAFYALMKNIVGIRWFGTADEDIVFTKENSFPVKSNIPEVPLRGIESNIKKWADNGFIKKFMLWMARNGWNQLLINARRWEEYENKDILKQFADNCAIELVLGGHSMDLFLPNSMLDTHPQFFGLRNGERCINADINIADLPERKIKGTIQPCLSNHAAIEFIASNIAAFIKKYSWLNIFSLWPHDGINNWCQCDKCKNTSPFELILNLVDAIEKRIPENIFFELLAYTNLLKTPEYDINIHDRCYMLFCPYLRSYKKRLYTSGLKEDELKLGTCYPEPDPVYPVDDREYGLLLKKWLPILKKSNINLGIFAYYQLAFLDERMLDDRARYMRLPEPALVQDEIKYFCKNEMLVHYDCSWPYPGFWPDSRLYSFYSELLWNPECNIKFFEKDYYNAMQIIPDELNNFCQKLDDGQRDFSDFEYSKLEQEISKSPEIQQERFKLWLEYTKLAAKTWLEIINNDKDKALIHEKAVKHFLEDNSSVLNKYVSTEWLLAYSKGLEANLSSGQSQGALPQN